MVRVLFVCLGNICRSPMAEGVFRKLVADEGLGDRIDIDSAGTSGYHVGEMPDRRARQAALRRGVSLDGQRARRVSADDFMRFDYLLAMDESNLAELLRRCPAEARDRVGLFLDFAAEPPTREVPDPYYGGPDGFDRVLDLVEVGARGLLAHVQERDL